MLKGKSRLLSVTVAGSLLALPALAIEPIPGFYQEPGINPNREYISQHISERIDPFTGKLQIHAVDLFIPGAGGLNIQVQRSYSSVNEDFVEPTAMGMGWTINFGRVLRRGPMPICDNQDVTPTQMPVLELPDGSRQILYLSPDHTYWITINRWKATCSPQGGLNVFAPDGTLYEMTRPGVPAGPASAPQNGWYVSKITDRNGNTLQFQYVDLAFASAVSQITASDGRVVAFTYENNVLSTVSDGIRPPWRYRYVYSDNPGGEGYPFLKEVERPDGRKWVFEYNLVKTQAAGALSMRRMQYPTGGWFDYEYGVVSFNQSLPRTTVVSRKTDSAGNVWEFAFAPAKRACTPTPDGLACSFDADSVDRTTVFAPDGVTEYEHVGANSVTAGLIYSIGLPLRRIVDQGQEVDVTAWAPQVISNVLNFRPSGLPGGVYDSGIGAPLTAGRIITRNGQDYQTTYSNFDDFGNARTVSEIGPNKDNLFGVQGRTSQLTFYTDPARWIIRVLKDESISALGNVIRTFDEDANLLSENRYGVTTNYTYHPSGDMETRIDARGKVSRLLNYWRGIPQREEHAEGVTIVRVVDDAGNVRSETDGENATVGYEYDALNRIIAIDHPLGNDVRVDWFDASRVVTRGNYIGTTSFDGFGRVTAVTHSDTATSAQIEQRFINDVYGRQIHASYPNATIGTRTRYDQLGRVSRVDHAAPETGGPGAAFAEKYFSGARVRLTNERGFLYEYVHSAYGNPDRAELIGIVAPEPGASVTMQRNGLGQATLVSQGGVTRQFVYDTRYFLTQQVDPETGLTLYGRDEVGNMTSRKVGTSGTTVFAYDDRNRLKTVTYPAGTASVLRAYYRDDRLKTVESAVALRDYTFDANKNLRTERLITGGQTFQLGYDYNANDALSSITYGSGLQVDYQPDAFGRPTQALPFAGAVEHHPGGAVSRIVYANGVETRFALHARQWTESIVARLGASPISNLAYGYDGIGNVTSLSDTQDPAADRAFSYDALDRLIGMPNVTQQTAWYDAVGNMWFNPNVAGASGPVRHFSYAGNRLWQVNTMMPPSFSHVQTLDYDVYGNVTRRGSASFAFNDALQMRCALCGQANEVQYAYDGQGIRVSSTQSGRTTFFVHGSGGNLMWDVAPDAELKEYIYVGGKQIAVRRFLP